VAYRVGKGPCPWLPVWPIFRGKIGSRMPVSMLAVHIFLTKVCCGVSQLLGDAGLKYDKKCLILFNFENFLKCNKNGLKTCESLNQRVKLCFGLLKFWMILQEKCDFCGKFVWVSFVQLSTSRYVDSLLILKSAKRKWVSQG